MFVPYFAAGIQDKGLSAQWTKHIDQTNRYYYFIIRFFFRFFSLHIYIYLIADEPLAEAEAFLNGVRTLFW